MSEDNQGQATDNQDPNTSASDTTTTVTLTEPSWRDGLDPAIKDHPSLATFKTPADVAKSYVEAQKLIGKEKLPVPSKDADPMAEGGNEEFNMVYDRLGRPSDPKNYAIPEVEKFDGMPEVPEQVIDEFKSFAHKIGLLPHQVSAIYQWQHNQTAEGFKSNGEAVTKGLQESEASMRKEFGKAFDANIAGARNILTKFGGPEVMQALEASGLGNDPHLIRMMIKISQQFGEDGNINLGDSQPNILTPQEAKLEIDKIMADKPGAYWNPTDEKGRKKFSDSEHKAMVQKLADLNAMAYPTK